MYHEFMITVELFNTEYETYIHGFCIINRNDRYFKRGYISFTELKSEYRPNHKQSELT